MESLDRLIALAGLHGKLDLRCLLGGEWSLDHPRAPLGVAHYHVVLAGGCVAEFDGHPPITLSAGDILLLPRGARHVLRSPHASPDCRSRPVQELHPVLPVRRLGDGPAELDMLCGSVHYAARTPLMQSLPEQLVVSTRDAGGRTSLAGVVVALRNEIDAARPAARAIVDSLSAALFALVLRGYVEQQPTVGGVLPLLNDHRMAPMLQAMLEDPGRDWNIEDLAALASMSRATFMRAFARLTDSTPGVLLTGLRMERARTLLTSTRRSLLEIATEVGYQSEAAFSKKFKQWSGVSPGRYRKGGDAMIVAGVVEEGGAG